MRDNIPLSGMRLWADLMEIAAIGGTAKGGCNRQTLTDLDGAGASRWASHCVSIGWAT